ncbi:MAG: hypothetical protein Q8K63_13515 [Acidimicrobiales bacterium]|nr:hypothetical protein [Acidimicrobiales bacterium]
MLRRLALGLLVIGLLGGAPIAAQAAPPTPSFTTLQPGQPPKLTETLPVQIVLVGYEPDLVPEEHLRAYLADSVEPVDRRRSERSGKAEFMGLTYDLDYSVTYADLAYENAFFGYLTQIGVDEDVLSRVDISYFQSLYNQQKTRSETIVDNLVIDGAKVEQWLNANPAPGVDPTRNTVVFVNWWGRPDFRFHEYEVSGDPQSEQNIDWGTRFWNSRLMAWGGTSGTDTQGSGRPSRTWFHDLSAGPDWRTSGWFLDDPLQRRGLPDPNEDLFFAPIWDYLNGNPSVAERAPIPDMLGLLTRFVAVNSMFAASPIYGYGPDAHVAVDPELDVTVQNAIGRPVFTESLLRQEMSELLGYNPRIDVDHRPLTGFQTQCLSDAAADRLCRPEADPSVYGIDLANLFFSAEKSQPQWRDGSAEFELPAFVQATEIDGNWVGASTDNFTDGTGVAAYALPTSKSLEFGWGSTSSLLHEYGHVVGVSHPHDGWEGNWYEGNFGPEWLNFVWVGDEVNSVMSYLNLTNDFSQFDKDNFGRWQAARFLRGANRIAADVLASRNARAGTADLVRADAAFTRAQAALHAHDYVNAQHHARDGYMATRAAATASNTPVPKSTVAWDVAQPGKWHGQAQPTHADFSADPVDATALVSREAAVSR